MTKPNMTKRVGRWLLSLTDTTATRVEPPPSRRDTDCRDCRKIKGEASVVIWHDDAVEMEIHPNGGFTPARPEDRDWDGIAIRDREGNCIRLDRILLDEAVALMDEWEPRYRAVEKPKPNVVEKLTELSEQLVGLSARINDAIEEVDVGVVEVDDIHNRALQQAADDSIITLLSVALAAVIDDDSTIPHGKRFPLVHFFSTFGGALRAVPDSFNYDAGPYCVSRDGDQLLITRRTPKG